MQKPSGTTNFRCGTCDSQFEDRDAREAHLDATGHGDRRAAAQRTSGIPAAVAATTPISRLPLQSRPQAGAPASNQYGTFTVHYATDKQTAFIASLLDRKDLATFTGDADALRQQVADKQVNKTAASAIIDALLALPERTAAPAQSTTGRPASEKALALLKSLIAERDLSGLGESDTRKINFVNNGGHPSAAGTSTLIDTLFAAPKAAGSFELVKGDIHVVDGKYVRVHFAQNSGNAYACVANIIREAVWENGTVVTPGEVEWEFESGLVNRLSADTKATAEQAKQFATLAGRCIFCSRAIDTPESTAVGYGPVCADKYGLPWGDTTEVIAQTSPTA